MLEKGEVILENEWGSFYSIYNNTMTLQHMLEDR